MVAEICLPVLVSFFLQVRCLRTNHFIPGMLQERMVRSGCSICAILSTRRSFTRMFSISHCCDWPGISKIRTILPLSLWILPRFVEILDVVQFSLMVDSHQYSHWFKSKGNCLAMVSSLLEYVRMINCVGISFWNFKNSMSFLSAI